MKRIVLLLSISVLAVVILASVQLAEAQQTGKVYRIGYLGGRSALPTTEVAFREGLRELGYVEGQNLVIEYRYAGFAKRPLGELAGKLAAELVRLKVDVIVTSSAPPVIRAAQRTTRTIPIVMGGVHGDPVEAGFVASLARPGGNITGLTNLSSKLHPKRLELLKEAFPRMSRVAILWPPDHQEHAMKEVKAVGQALGIQIQFLVVRQGLGILESAFSAILHSGRAQPRESPRGLLVAATAITLRHRARIIDFAAGRRLPTIYARSRFVKAGGLMSYGADLQHLYRRVAVYVDKILKGAKPGDLPLERPTKFDLVINLKTAKQLGITIPPGVLLQATKVIK